MNPAELFSVLLTGAIAGWLASLALKIKGLGLFGYTVIGIVGAIVGNWALGQLGVSLGGSFLREIANAFIGAVLVLLLVSALKR